MNEPTFATIGGAPNGYDAAAYARDFAVFRAFAKQSAPGMLILGPGGVGEGSSLATRHADALALDRESPSGHRAMASTLFRITPTEASPAAARLPVRRWPIRPRLPCRQSGSREPVGIEEFYAKLRDKYEPGKPMWLTETAETACGGDRWASTFLDSFPLPESVGTAGQARRTDAHAQHPRVERLRPAR